MSVKRNIVANYVGQGVASLLSLALVPVYIRYLGIEAYGLVGLFAIVQGWLSLLDLGLTPTLAREMARFTGGGVTVQHVRDLLRSLEVIYLGMAASMALALTLGSGWLATRWFNVEQLPVETAAGALSLLGAVVALRFCEGIYRSGISGLQQQVWLNGASVAFAVLRTVGAWAVLAFVSPTLQAFFLWQGFVSLLSLVVLAAKLKLALPRSPRSPRFSLDALKAVRGFAGGVFGITVVSLLLTQVDKLVLSRAASLAEFGYYTLAATVSGGLWLVGAPVVIAAGPALTRLVEAGDAARLARAYHDAAQLVTVVLAPAALLLMLFPRGVLFAWSGDAAMAGHVAPLLALLAAGTFLNSLWQVPYQLQVAAGWVALSLRLGLAALTLGLVALLTTVPLYGAVAAAGTWAGINLLYMLVGMPLLHRRLLRGELRRWAGGDVLAPIGGAAMVMLAAWLIHPATAAGRLEWLSFVVMAGGLGTLAAAAAATSIRERFVAAVRFTLARRRRRLGQG